MSNIKQSNKHESMLTGPIGPTIIRMAVPTIMATLITSIYHLADTYFVSTLGTNATAAVSVNSSSIILPKISRSFRTRRKQLFQRRCG